MYCHGHHQYMDFRAVCVQFCHSFKRACMFLRAGGRRWYGRCITWGRTQITIEVFLTLLPTGGFMFKQTSEFWHKCDHWHPHWNGMNKLAYACFITGILHVASTSDNWFWTWHLILSGWFFVLWFPHLSSGYCIDQCLQLSSNFCSCVLWLPHLPPFHCIDHR